MVAIQPARLKKQVSVLAEKFSQPASFVHDLHNLLHQYSDHTHRSGQSGEPLPLIGSYNTPPPVLRQVWLALAPLIKDRPAEVLPLCDALWAEPNYDLKLMAARFLGQLPVDYSEPVMSRLRSWIHQDLDKRLLEGLLEYGLEGLQLYAPQQVMDMVTSWLQSSEILYQQAGLRALPPLITGSGQAYLPAIIRSFTPYVRVAPSRLRPDILAALIALVKSSPAETAYLLRQNLSVADNPDTAWLIRQVLSQFPPESQAGLRQALKKVN